MEANNILNLERAADLAYPGVYYAERNDEDSEDALASVSASKETSDDQRTDLGSRRSAYARNRERRSR